MAVHREPSLFLFAAVDLDQASVISLHGNVEDAIELARQAASQATTAGWSRGIVAAAANLGYMYSLKGNYSEANKQLELASTQRFRSVDLDFAIADTRARAALSAGDYATAELLLAGYSDDEAQSDAWYVLAAGETRFRALMGGHHYERAMEVAQAALKLAQQVGSGPFTQCFQVAVAQAQLALGFSGTHVCLPNSRSIVEDAAELSTSWEMWTTVLNASGSTVRAKAYRVRARNLEKGLGRVPREPEQLSGMDPAEAASGDVAAGLDAAIALLQLCEYPQLLGSEILCTIQETGLAAGAAVIVAQRNGPKVVDTRGWSESAASAMARRTDSYIERIELGERGDESWALLVEPRPEAPHRCTLDAIRKLVATALTLDRYRREEKQRAALWPAEALDGDPESVWASEQMSEILGIARRIAPTPLSILLTGETGTGKEMLARAIHRASDRAGRTFLPFNCTAVPRDMLESQLFGHRKGAFTGADAPFPGVIRAAAGGTLFLDEIADISLDLQPKLLRFLETREIHPLGEPQPIQVDVRIIAATNASLEQLVAEGRFREDLFYRLNVVRLRLPPLRERREEIPALTEHYLRRYGDEYGKRRLSLADETLEYLLLYAWPGNVRQLANEIRRIVAMAEPGATITPALLSPEIQASRRTIPAGGVAPEAEVRVRIDQPLPAAVETLEQLMVRHALDRARGRVEQAARLLGISRKGLFLKRRRWGIAATQPPEA